MNRASDNGFAQMDELLRRAAEHFQFPPTPDLADAVIARIRQPAVAPRRPRARWRLVPRWVAPVALAAAVLAAVAAIAVPGSRSAVAGFFHLSHVTIKQDNNPAGSPTPPVLAPGNFARPSSIPEASERVGIPLRLPTSDGQPLQPDAVYLQAEEISTPIAILVYGKGGYDIYETRAAYIEKLVKGPAAVQDVIVSGHQAYWIAQGGHIVQSVDSSGRVVVASQRTVDRATLVWEEDGVTYRIESSLSKEQTIAVAESLR